MSQISTLLFNRVKYKKKSITDIIYLLIQTTKLFFLIKLDVCNKKENREGLKRGIVDHNIAF